MKKKRNFIKIFTFIITLSLTFGFGLILSSNQVSASSSDGQPYLVSYVEPGVYYPVSYEPYYDTITQTSTLKFDFTYRDENTEELIDMKSITMEVENGIYRLYFNVGNNYSPYTSILIGYSVANDWVRSCTIIVNQKQNLPDVELTNFLEHNYENFVKRGYQVFGRYTFNNGNLINTLGKVFDKEFNVTGYFLTPLKYTNTELERDFGITDLRAGDYYLSTFNKLVINSSNGVKFDDLSFNMYLPSANKFGLVGIVSETDQIIWQESYKDIIFDKQVIPVELYEFLETNGTFNYVPEPEEYTPTDLIFAFVDAPIRFLQSLLSFELLGYKFWIIFSSIITLSIAIYLITLKKSGD